MAERLRRPSIVHLGFGAFARAHTAVYTEEANRLSGGIPWRIIGVTQRSAAVADQLNPQDGLYTVVEEGPDADGAQLITCVDRVLDGPANPQAVVEAIAAPGTHIVSLTITEKGYRFDPRTGRVSLEDPQIRQDLAGGAPKTAVGQLVRGIQRRAAAGAGPLTVLSCDNLPGNGRLTAGIVESFVQALPEAESAALMDRITHSVRFPSTMVDRMVPQPTEATARAAEAAFGIHDAGAVPGEHFRQWVLEDDFAGPRPAWEAAGAEFSDQVEQWEAVKLRILNAGHTLLAYLGLHRGCATIAESVEDPVLAEACRRLFSEEVIPTLEAPQGVDVRAYGEEVLRRFANPALGHTTQKVGTDGSQKLGPRLLGTVERNLERGRVPRYAALAVAAWFHHLTSAGEQVSDPLGERLLGRVQGATAPEGVVRALLGETEVFPEAVGGHPGFAEAVTGWYGILQRQDPETLREEVGDV